MSDPDTTPTELRLLAVIFGEDPEVTEKWWREREARPAEEKEREAAEGIAQVEEMLSVLHPVEREVCVLRFGLDRGEPRTLEEVGAHLNISRERVRQIEHQAMERLRKPE